MENENPTQSSVITLSNLMHYHDNLKTYIGAQIANASHLKFEKPAGGILPDLSQAKADVIYLIPRGETGQESRDTYNEFFVIDFGLPTAHYELIGNTAVDFSNYYTKAETDSAISGAVAAKNVGASGDDYVAASASGNSVSVSATQKTKTSLGLADSALQSVTVMGHTLSKSASSLTKTQVVSDLNDSFDAKGAAGNALAEAQSYADEKKSEAITSANGYTDTKAQQAYTSAKKHADDLVAPINESLANKVDKVEGKGLIDSAVASSLSMEGTAGTGTIVASRPMRFENGQSKFSLLPSGLQVQDDVNGEIVMIGSGAIAVGNSKREEAITLTLEDGFLKNGEPLYEVIGAASSAASTLANTAISASGKDDDALVSVALGGKVGAPTVAVNVTTATNAEIDAMF